MNHRDISLVRENFLQIQNLLLSLQDLPSSLRTELYLRGANPVMSDHLLSQYQDFTKLILTECDEASVSEESSEIPRLLSAYHEVIEDLANFLKVSPEDEMTQRMSQVKGLLEEYQR